VLPCLNKHLLMLLLLVVAGLQGLERLVVPKHSVNAMRA
jgi:hypothetical protein